MVYFFKDPFDCFGEEVGQMMIVETGPSLFQSILWKYLCEVVITHHLNPNSLFFLHKYVHLHLVVFI